MKKKITKKTTKLKPIEIFLKERKNRKLFLLDRAKNGLVLTSYEYHDYEDPKLQVENLTWQESDKLDATETDLRTFQSFLYALISDYGPRQSDHDAENIFVEIKPGRETGILSGDQLSLVSDLIDVIKNSSWDKKTILSILGNMIETKKFNAPPKCKTGRRDPLAPDKEIPRYKGNDLNLSDLKVGQEIWIKLDNTPDDSPIFTWTDKWVELTINFLAGNAQGEGTLEFRKNKYKLKMINFSFYKTNNAISLTRPEESITHSRIKIVKSYLTVKDWHYKNSDSMWKRGREEDRDIKILLDLLPEKIAKKLWDEYAPEEFKNDYLRGVVGAK